jgi:transposase
MLLAHRIRLEPTPQQCDYLARAAGTARRVWNWALAEWQRQSTAGLQPDAMALAFVTLAADESSYTTGQVYGVAGGAGNP